MIQRDKHTIQNFLWEKHLQDQKRDGRITLRWTLSKQVVKV